MKVNEHAKMRKTIAAIPGEAPAAIIAYIDPRKKAIKVSCFGTDEGTGELLCYMKELVDDALQNTEGGAEE